jgi:3-dehydroquinate dehydratase-2
MQVMKKYLLPETGNFYKANLHCHTTISDGRKTPEEIKDLYMKKGYSIVAYTDHEVFLLHNDLTDDRFLAMNGFEVEIMNWYGRHPLRDCKVCHLCFVALNPEMELHPFWHRSKHVWGPAKEYKDQVKFDDSLKDYNWSYTPESITEMMQIAREEGLEITQFQSNHEGAIVDKIQACYGEIDGIVINPAAYTHTSVAILDALKSVAIPAVEVHISDVDAREPFRQISYAGMYCEKTIKGQGLNGYRQAILYLKDKYCK